MRGASSPSPGAANASHLQDQRDAPGTICVLAPLTSSHPRARHSVEACNERAKSLAGGGDIVYLVNAQFRTCLWPCVDRWASGQEAGQPPKGVSSLPCSCDRQPEANRCTPLSTGDAA